MTDGEKWRHSLARLRATTQAGKARKKSAVLGVPPELGQEAMMTLVAIMNDETDPRLQIAAAKTLLSRSTQLPAATPENQHLTPVMAMRDDELDAAIAVAKALLDELASRKAAGLSGAGALAANGASGADHTGG